MIRRWISWTVLVGVVIGLAAAGLAEVGAQQEVRRPSLAERLAALRQAVASEEPRPEDPKGPKDLGGPKDSEELDGQVAEPVEKPTRSNTQRVRSSMPKRSWRGAFQQRPVQVESTEPPAQRSRSKNQLLPSFDPLKILPFRSPQEETASPSAQRPKNRQSHVTSRRTRPQARSHSTHQSPMERRRKSADGLRGTTGSISIAEPQEMVDDAPSIVSGVHGSVKEVEQPVEADDHPVIDMKEVDSTPIVSSRRRRSPDAARSAPIIDARTPAGRRSPLRIEVSDSVPGIQDASKDDRDVDSVLFTEMASAVSSRVMGPNEIVIGQQAKYRVLLRNNGRTDADGVVVEVDIPGSTEVVTSESSHGFAQQSVQSGLEWQIHQLPEGETAALDLTLIPRSSEPLTLGVTVRTAPLVGQTVVTVQEPKLELALQGPADLLLGESEIYRLRVSNPGTGPARNVVLHLIPPGGGAEQQSSHAVGLLPAGKIETFEIELTARDAGQLRVMAFAEAEGELRADCEKRVFVRCPELAVEAAGLSKTYAGTVAAYRFLVRNNGTADAEQVLLMVQLPPDAQLVEASEGHQKNIAGQPVTWNVGNLTAGQDYIAEMRCLVNKPGDNDVVAVAQTADGGLHVKAIQTTHVVALADLKLEISDPVGPVAVGSEAMYEIRIRNRGSNTAKAIQVVALFSDGIDPVAIDGGQSTVRNGRIAFHKIDSLTPGRDVTLRIRAVANTPGTHVFRAEVLCSELETKLSSEETTRYFATDFGRSDHASIAKKPSDASSR